MSFSDLILAIFILAVAACVVWLMELNPYSKTFQVYSQTCDNMILDNTHCKGEWHDNEVQTYTINQGINQVVLKSNNQQSNKVFDNCTIEDSKNWSCIDESTVEPITVNDGLLVQLENSDTRQISRLEWAQNIILEKFN